MQYFSKGFPLHSIYGFILKISAWVNIIIKHKFSQVKQAIFTVVWLTLSSWCKERASGLRGNCEYVEWIVWHEVPLWLGVQTWYPQQPPPIMKRRYSIKKCNRGPQFLTYDVLLSHDGSSQQMRCGITHFQEVWTR
jgi:hypothetical protein